MKTLLLSLILVISTQVQAQTVETYFENTNASVKEQNLAAEALEAHRILALLARMSVFAFHCGVQEDHVRFSQIYKSLFTELSGGKVKYNALVFTNPIETMRNIAVLRFLLTKQRPNIRRQVTCEQNKIEFQNFLNMNAHQIKSYSSLRDDQQSSYLESVRSVGQISAQVIALPSESAEIQVSPDTE